jgi:hypothetical protein
VVAFFVPRASACVCVTEKGYGLMIDHPVAVISQEGLAGMRAEGVRVIGPRPTREHASRLFPTACTGNRRH